MRLRHTQLALFVLFAIAVAPTPPAVADAILPTGFSDELIASGLNFPVSMAFLPDGRLVVTEKNDARVRLVRDHSLVPTPVLVLDSVRTSSESGLLGIAVDPGWPVRPYLYVLYNWSGGPFIRLSRFNASGDLDNTGAGTFTADPFSEYVILGDLQDDSIFHNGGTLRFAPDGMLYAALGDDTQGCYALHEDQLVGKILRLDVSTLPDGPGALVDLAAITPPDNPFVSHVSPRARLVWAYGLRNPWSFHFDPPSERLFVADVGAAAFEEIDLVDAPGLKFGWPFFEADSAWSIPCFGQDTTGHRLPIHYYDRQEFETGAAVVSGGVYRRPAGATQPFPLEYEGDYFFSDIGAGFLRRLHEQGGAWTIADSVPGQPSASDWGRGMEVATDFLVAADGSLWYVKYFARFEANAGEIRRIVHYGVTGVGPEVRRPTALERPYPLPARGRVTLGFRLERGGPVRLTVHDLLGREIRALISGESHPPGAHAAGWDGCNAQGDHAPAGVYMVRLASPDGLATRRCVLLR